MWDTIYCVDEWFLPNECTLPIQIVWFCIFLFIISLIMTFIIGFSEKSRNFQILINVFSLVFIQTPYSLWLREFAYLLTIKEIWEQVIILCIILLNLILFIFTFGNVFVTIHIILLVSVTVYYYHVYQKKDENDKILLLIDCFFTFLYVMFYFFKVKYGTYIVLIISIFPAIFIYLYEEGLIKIKNISISKIRIGFYFLSLIFILQLFGYSFRFLATSIHPREYIEYTEQKVKEADEEALLAEVVEEEEEEVEEIPTAKVITYDTVPIEAYKLSWGYYLFVVFGLVLLIILISLNQTEGTFLAYGLLISICYFYLLYKRPTLVYFFSLFFNVIIFWTIQVPLFYTGNQYVWVYILPATYSFIVFYYEKEPVLNEKLSKELLQYYSYIRAFLYGFIIFFCILWAVVLNIMIVFYAAELERILYTLF